MKLITSINSTMRRISRRCCLQTLAIFFITSNLLVAWQWWPAKVNTNIGRTEKLFNPRRIGSNNRFKDINQKALLRAASDFPRLPLMFLVENSESDWFYGDDPNCAPLPMLVDLHISNDHWQGGQGCQADTFHVLDTWDGPVFLFSAFLDGRQISRKEKRGPTVRIFALLKGIASPLKLHCQVWFKGLHSPLLTAATVVYMGIESPNYRKYYADDLQQNMIFCEVPFSMSHNKPVLVSVVNEPCDYARNALKLSYNRRKPGVKRKNFAVCVKPQIYPYEDRSGRLVEWIEILVAMGVDKIVIFNFQAHANMEKVLQHYEDRGIVDVIPFSMPGYLPNHPHLQYLLTRHRYIYQETMDVLVYHSCFYELWDHFQWFSLIDTDEVIIPRRQITWTDMLEGVENVTQYSELIFQSARYPEKVTDLTETSGLYMMDHYMRNTEFDTTKCIFNSDSSLVLFNHWAIQCIGLCVPYDVDPSYAIVSHFRVGVVESKNLTDERELLWRYKEHLMKRVQTVMAKLRIG